MAGYLFYVWVILSRFEYNLIYSLSRYLFLSALQFRSEFFGHVSVRHNWPHRSFMDIQNNVAGSMLVSCIWRFHYLTLKQTFWSIFLQYTDYFEFENPLCDKMFWGHSLVQRLRYCATNRKVGGSIPDGVIGIFHLHPSGRTMALGSTQPLTEMSSRNIFWE
jgi:hypothetical protein